jgi:hypothetical protein
VFVDLGQDKLDRSFFRPHVASRSADCLGIERSAIALEADHSPLSASRSAVRPPGAIAQAQRERGPEKAPRILAMAASKKEPTLSDLNAGDHRPAAVHGRVAGPASPGPA